MFFKTNFPCSHHFYDIWILYWNGWTRSRFLRSILSMCSFIKLLIELPNFIHCVVSFPMIAEDVFFASRIKSTQITRFLSRRWPLCFFMRWSWLGTFPRWYLARMVLDICISFLLLLLSLFLCTTWSWCMWRCLLTLL